MDQIYWMADNDPVKIEQFLKLPLWEYWQVLNARLAILHKQKKK